MRTRRGPSSDAAMQLETPPPATAPDSYVGDGGEGRDLEVSHTEMQPAWVLTRHLSDLPFLHPKRCQGMHHLRGLLLSELIILGDLSLVPGH